MLSAEAYSKHSFNVSGVIFDELHTQPNRALFDVMTKGSGDARTQPLYFLITTAGTDTHSVCFEQHQKAKDLLAGKEVDPTFYPVVYGADPEDDWLDENVWRKANPSLGGDGPDRQSPRHRTQCTHQPSRRKQLPPTPPEPMGETVHPMDAHAHLEPEQPARRSG